MDFNQQQFALLQAIADNYDFEMLDDEDGCWYETTHQQVISMILDDREDMVRVRSASVNFGNFQVPRPSRTKTKSHDIPTAIRLDANNHDIRGADFLKVMTLYFKSNQDARSFLHGLESYINTLY